MITKGAEILLRRGNASGRVRTRERQIDRCPIEQQFITNQQLNDSETTTWTRAWPSILIQVLILHYTWLLWQVSNRNSAYISVQLNPMRTFRRLKAFKVNSPWFTFFVFFVAVALSSDRSEVSQDWPQTYLFISDQQSGQKVSPSQNQWRRLKPKKNSGRFFISGAELFLIHRNRFRCNKNRTFLLPRKNRRTGRLRLSGWSSLPVGWEN